MGWLEGRERAEARVSEMGREGVELDRADRMRPDFCGGWSAIAFELRGLGPLNDLD